MRPFFKRPSWATRGDEDLDSDFYRRAGQTYADIIAASREARDGLTNIAGNTSTEDDGKACKRRHISPEPVSEYLAFPVPDDDLEQNGGQIMFSPSVEACRTSPKGGGDRNGCQVLVQAPTDELSVTDTSNVDHSSTGTTLNAQSTHSYPSPGIIAKIIEGKEAVTNHSGCRDARDNQHDVAARTDRYSRPTDEDAIVRILITSKIENTRPLIIHRKISQALRDVRLTWCNRQNIPKERQSSIFLTWKGRRLFDFTTCRSLGADLGKGPADSLMHVDYLQHGSKEDIRVHMEAVTEDFLMPTNDRWALPTSYSGWAQETAATVDDSSECSSTRVVLKCPGFGYLNQSFSPNTQISELIAVFRDAKIIPTNREVYLVFDGDRLDPNARLTDYDMSDDDLVDVMVK
ncbi:hypothetical protein BBP40_003645 [Aspergillus hancockii]|nr:hypothetical protein BBP40_003645 [Aspergillus hancockii]